MNLYQLGGTTDSFVAKKIAAKATGIEKHSENWNQSLDFYLGRFWKRKQKKKRMCLRSSSGGVRLSADLCSTRKNLSSNLNNLKIQIK